MIGYDEIPLEEQQLYILLDDTGSTNYKNTRGWETGTVLRRISKWLGSNGCGRHLKQAYFVPVDSQTDYGRIAWSDHVKEITDGEQPEQMEMDI